MARIVVWTLLLLAGYCYGSERIMGGQPAEIEKYPSVVQVEYFRSNTNVWNQGCAANILNNLYVLSAAHCFHVQHVQNYQRHTTRIRAGTADRGSGGIIINIVREFNHPTFWTNPQRGHDADVSVVRLATPLTFSDVIQPAKIPPQGAVIPDGASVVHAGWGAIRHFGPHSPVLLDVEIFTINNELCRRRYLSLRWPDGPLFVTPNMICAGILDVGGRDACRADSGGPMFYQGLTVGVVSWGHECGHRTYPGVSAAVASYTDWIVDIASRP